MSNAPLVKSALKALIEALPERQVEKWQTTWSYTRDPHATWVYIGGIDWESADWKTNVSRDEHFFLKMVINIRRRRKTPEETELEAMRISNLIETAVNGSHNMGLPKIISCGFVPVSMDSYPSDDVCECQMVVGIKIKARV